MTSAIEIINVFVKLGMYSALENVSASINPGDFVGIIGPNGAGKTTLLKVILGLQSVESGEIKILGRSLRNSESEWIGYVPQLKTIDRNFPAVTCDIVASGIRRSWPGILTKTDHDEIHEALETVGADHLCHKPLGHLSGGEIQRVYLARAIARKPKILLLDEPATGIDAVGEDHMYKILDSYLEKSNITVLMVTHDWLTARHHATRVMLLNRRLISFGPPSEALSDKFLSEAFGHTGHVHQLVGNGGGHDG